MSFRKYSQFLLVLIVVMASVTTAWGQSFQTVVSSSLSSGNIKELAKSFDKRIQVTIDRKTDYYSNSQAEMILKNQLDQMGPKNFRLIRKGMAEGGNAEFYIGEISCTKGITKVYIYSRLVSDIPYIQEIRLEKK